MTRNKTRLIHLQCIVKLECNAQKGILMSYSVQCNTTLQFPSIPIEVESSFYSAVLVILPMLTCVFAGALIFGLEKGTFNIW